MGYNITKTHLKHTSFDGPMSVDRQQRNISTPQHEISFHRVQRLHSVNQLQTTFFWKQVEKILCGLIAQQVQIHFIFANYVLLLCLSCIIKKSKTTTGGRRNRTAWAQHGLEFYRGRGLGAKSPISCRLLAGFFFFC